MGTFFDIQKWYAILFKVWCVAGHEIFIESKCKGCYTIEDFLLSNDVEFFLYGVLKVSTRSCLHGLHCGMIVKVHDNA